MNDIKIKQSLEARHNLYKTHHIDVNYSEWPEIYLDKRILPLFTTPILLKKRLERKVNKYKFEVTDYQRKNNLNYKIVNFNQILNVLVTKVVTFGYEVDYNLKYEDNKVFLVKQIKDRNESIDLYNPIFKIFDRSFANFFEGKSYKDSFNIDNNLINNKKHYNMLLLNYLKENNNLPFNYSDAYENIINYYTNKQIQEEIKNRNTFSLYNLEKKYFSLNDFNVNINKLLLHILSRAYGLDNKMGIKLKTNKKDNLYTQSNLYPTDISKFNYNLDLYINIKKGKNKNLKNINSYNTKRNYNIVIRNFDEILKNIIPNFNNLKVLNDIIYNKIDNNNNINNIIKKNNKIFKGKMNKFKNNYNSHTVVKSYNLIKRGSNIAQYKKIFYLVNNKLPGLNKRIIFNEAIKANPNLNNFISFNDNNNSINYLTENNFNKFMLIFNNNNKLINNKKVYKTINNFFIGNFNKLDKNLVANFFIKILENNNMKIWFKGMVIRNIVKKIPRIRNMFDNKRLVLRKVRSRKSSISTYFVKKIKLNKKTKLNRKQSNKKLKRNLNLNNSIKKNKNLVKKTILSLQIKNFFKNINSDLNKNVSNNIINKKNMNINISKNKNKNNNKNKNIIKLINKRKRNLTIVSLLKFNYINNISKNNKNNINNNIYLNKKNNIVSNVLSIIRGKIICNSIKVNYFEKNLNREFIFWINMNNWYSKLCVDIKNNNISNVKDLYYLAYISAFNLYVFKLFLEFILNLDNSLNFKKNKKKSNLTRYKDFQNNFEKMVESNFDLNTQMKEFIKLKLYFNSNNNLFYKFMNRVNNKQVFLEDQYNSYFKTNSNIPKFNFSSTIYSFPFINKPKFKELTLIDGIDTVYKLFSKKLDIIAKFDNNNIKDFYENIYSMNSFKNEDLVNINKNNLVLDSKVEENNNKNININKINQTNKIIDYSIYNPLFIFRPKFYNNLHIQSFSYSNFKAEDNLNNLFSQKNNNANIYSVIDSLDINKNNNTDNNKFLAPSLSSSFKNHYSIFYNRKNSSKDNLFNNLGQGWWNSSIFDFNFNKNLQKEKIINKLNDLGIDLSYKINKNYSKTARNIYYDLFIKRNLNNNNYENLYYLVKDKIDSNKYSNITFDYNNFNFLIKTNPVNMVYNVFKKNQYIENKLINISKVIKFFKNNVFYLNKFKNNCNNKFVLSNKEIKDLERLFPIIKKNNNFFLFNLIENGWKYSLFNKNNNNKFIIDNNNKFTKHVKIGFNNIIFDKEFNTLVNNITNIFTYSFFDFNNNATIENPIFPNNNLQFTSDNNNLPILYDYLKEMSYYNMSRKGVVLSFNKFISYFFSDKNTNKNNKLMRFIYDLLAQSFRPMFCLISKPVFVITPDKIVFKLFYYLFIPYLLKFKKRYNMNLFKRFKKVGILSAKEVRELKREGFSNIKKRRGDRKIKFFYLNLRKRKREVRKKMLLVSRNSLSSMFRNKFLLLTNVLSKIFKKSVELKLTRLHYHYADTNILANFLATMVNKRKLPIILIKLFGHMIFKRYNNIHTKKSMIPSFITGIKIRVAGRLLTTKIAPRKTVKKRKIGISATGKVNYSEFARYTNKNKRGSFSITVESGQNLFNFNK